MKNNTSDFEVAFAVARDILEWPPAELKKIALADEETQRAFVEWIKTRVMQRGESVRAVRAHESMRETFRSVYAAGGLTGEALEARVEERMCNPGPFDMLE